METFLVIYRVSYINGFCVDVNEMVVNWVFTFTAKSIDIIDYIPVDGRRYHRKVVSSSQAGTVHREMETIRKSISYGTSDKRSAKKKRGSRAGSMGKDETETDSVFIRTLFQLAAEES